jgi:hypothetical protein
MFDAFRCQSQYWLRGGEYLEYSSTINEFRDAGMIAGADSCVAVNEGDSGISGGGI